MRMIRIMIGPMYICLCNGLKETHVSSAIEAGATDVPKIFRHHGCAARCGNCVSFMRDEVCARLNECASRQSS